MSNGGPDDYERKITSGAIGAFSRYLMSHAYDVAIRETQLVLSGDAAAPKSRRLHGRLRALSEDQRQAASELARDAVLRCLVRCTVCCSGYRMTRIRSASCPLVRM